MGLLPGRPADHSCPALLILLLQLKFSVQITSFTSLLYIASWNSPVSSSKVPTEFFTEFSLAETDTELSKNVGSTKSGGTILSKVHSFNRITLSSALFAASSLCSLVLLGLIKLASSCT